MPGLHTPDQFKTRPAHFLMGLAGLILTYALATRAIDTGSLWQYLGTFLLLGLSVHMFIKTIRNK